MIAFQDFDLRDNERFIAHLNRCMQVSSNGSPVSVLGYKEKLQIERGYACGLCWHRYCIDDKELWAAPVGDWDEPDWRDIFRRLVPAGTTFLAVPEYLAKIWQRELGEDIRTESDRDNWDYIIQTGRIAKLYGKQYIGFRHLRNHFMKNYRYEIEEITPAIFDEMREFQKQVEDEMAGRVEDVETLQEYDDIFHYALDHWVELRNLFGSVIRVDGRIVAYVMDEQLDDASSIGLLIKADYRYRGAAQFAYWHHAVTCVERGILLQNIMDDVGEENLRFFKTHLGPAAMLKKYSVWYMPSEAESLPPDGARKTADDTQSSEEGARKTEDDTQRSGDGARTAADGMQKPGDSEQYEPIRDELAIDISGSTFPDAPLTVRLSGRLTEQAAQEAGRRISGVLDGAQNTTPGNTRNTAPGGVRSVVIDLACLTSICSSGLRMLAGALKKAEASGCVMTVMNARGQVRDALEMTGYAQILKLGEQAG